jgi:hypothetical protein
VNSEGKRIRQRRKSNVRNTNLAGERKLERLQQILSSNQVADSDTGIENLIPFSKCETKRKSSMVDVDFFARLVTYVRRSHDGFIFEVILLLSMRG